MSHELEQKAVEAARNAAQMLKSPDKLTFAEATEAMRDVGLHAVNLEQRATAIAPRTEKQTAGRLRVELASVGTPEAITELNAEHERLCILIDQLRAQQARLSEVRQTARNREAFQSLPGLYKTLANDVTAVEEALKLLADARRKARANVDAVTNARGLAARHGGALPKPDPKLIARMIAADPDSYAKNAQDFASRLGVQSVEGLRWAA